jgi:hypothetical protein
MHGHDNVVANDAAARKQSRCDIANRVWPCFHNLITSLLSSELPDHSLRCGGHIPWSACSPDFIFINFFIVVHKRSVFFFPANAVRVKYRIENSLQEFSLIDYEVGQNT